MASEEKCIESTSNEDELASNTNETADQSIDSGNEKLNANKIICTRCSCVILRAKQAKIITKEIELPMVSTRKDEESARELLSNYLLVESIYTFENMGFSNTVENMKYLVCAECEYGPLGCMNIDDKKSFLSLDRVIQKED